MKNTIFSTLIAAVTITSAHAQDFAYSPMEVQISEGVNIESIKDAGKEAITELITKFVADDAGENLKLFKVLPFTSDIDGGYFTRQLQNEFGAKGRSKGYERFTRNEQMFNQILKEIKWGDQFSDVMDPATIQKFGNLSGVQALIVPRLSLTSIKGESTLRMSLQGYEVETGKALPFAHEAKRVIEPPMAVWKWIVIGLIAFILLVILFKLLKALNDARYPRGSRI